jgi:hypothetical protein
MMNCVASVASNVSRIEYSLNINIKTLFLLTLFETESVLLIPLCSLTSGGLKVLVIEPAAFGASNAVQRNITG